jgi:hypothetical protein
LKKQHTKKEKKVKTSTTPRKEHQHTLGLSVLTKMPYGFVTRGSGQGGILARLVVLFTELDSIAMEGGGKGLGKEGECACSLVSSLAMGIVAVLEASVVVDVEAADGTCGCSS